MSPGLGRIAYLDCSTGVSGDKFLGALLDAGSAQGDFTAEMLRETIARLAPEAIVEIERVRSHGIAATSVRVSSPSTPAHRHLQDIRELLLASALPPAVAERSERVFTELAGAEAAVHGCEVDEVHFHEVGALDSIVDVVGTCAGLDALGIEYLIVSPVAVGAGTVATSHGILPVPAPATARLLVDVPVVSGEARSELTTPTGAALVRVCATAFGACPPMTPLAVGIGAGTRDLGTPNICQLIVGTPATPSPALLAEKIALLETNVDHLSGEAIGFTIAQLLAEGVHDAWATPITMKKGRPATLLSALVPADLAEGFSARIVALTGTLGVRSTVVERLAAERESRTIDTPWGSVRVKVGAGRVRPEADDVARIAQETMQPYSAVEDELARIAEESLG